MSLMPFDTANIVIFGLSIAILLLALDAILIRRKMKKILRGKNGSCIDDSISSMDKDIKALAHFQKESEAYLENVEKRLRRSVQGLETLRFNAFKGTGEGGNQSFATALLNEEGDGVVISSLYSRDRMSVFSKPVSHFVSKYELSDEENGVLDQAKEKISK